jgi:outer membrane immunogenic protein
VGSNVRKSLVAFIAALTFIPFGGAFAAPPLPQPPPTPPFTWTGFYLGVVSGHGSSHADSTRLVANGSFLAGTSSAVDRTGFLGGGEAGLNWQFNRWLVAGIEGDWQGSAISGTATEQSNVVAGRFTEESRDVDWVATAAGRLGVAWNQWLLFGKGGGAWRRINESALNTTFTPPGNTLHTNETVFPETQTGYVIGGGLEWAPSDMVSAKIEYDWYNFGTSLSPGGVCLAGAGCGGPGALVAGGDSQSKDTMWEIKAGLNIHFNGLTASVGH